MFLKNTTYYRIPEYVIDIFTTTAVLGIVFLATVWCLYFLSRIRELSRKIHYLKKQTEERCYEELTNAKVDYIKSIFIAAISASEVLEYICVAVVGTFHIFVNVKTDNCPFPIAFSKELHSFRVFMLLGVSCMIIFLSLSHILTSYLCHAYAEKRIITLTRRDKVLISCLLIQLVVMWISIANWRAFISIVPIMTMALFPIHLCLYVKYSRRLYMLLKRRRLDAWFEDPDSYKKLVGMCKEYKTGSILYTVCVIFLSTALAYALLLTGVQLVFRDTCLGDVFKGTNTSKITEFGNEHPKFLDIMRDVYHISTNVVACIALWALLFVHLIILYKFVKKEFRKRNSHRIHISDIHKPLIARK